MTSLRSLPAVRSCCVAAALVTSTMLGVTSCTSTSGSTVDGGPGEGGAGVVACTTPTAPACDAPTSVSDADAVLTMIGALTEATESTITPSSAAALRPTTGLRATLTIDVDVTAFRTRNAACPPGDAGSMRPTCTETLFAPEKPFYTSQNPVAGFPVYRQGTTYPPGVTCLTPSGSECEKIRIEAGTVVRFQRIVEEYRFVGRAKHLIRVVRDCATPCAAGEVFCSTSMTCFGGGKDACLLCDGKPVMTCACAAPCGTTVEGQKCQYNDSDDTGNGGTCTAGQCIAPR